MENKHVIISPVAALCGQSGCCPAWGPGGSFPVLFLLLVETQDVSPCPDSVLRARVLQTSRVARAGLLCECARLCV